MALLYNRVLSAICCNTYVVETDGSKKKDCHIVGPLKTFTTSFEGKYGMRHIARKEEIPHGKRKYSDPAGQGSAKPFDATL